MLLVDLVKLCRGVCGEGGSVGGGRWEGAAALAAANPQQKKRRGGEGGREGVGRDAAEANQ